MLNDSSRSHGSASDVRQSVEQCLRTVLTLSPSDLRSTDIRSTLANLQQTLQRLLSMDVSERPDKGCTPKDSGPAHKVRNSPNGADSLQDDEEQEQEQQEQQTKPWRMRVKSSAEKIEKKARLEKREAILKDLRSRVSQFRDGQTSEDSIKEPKAESASSVSFGTFEARKHRASFWPEGSADWARQILGIEIWMTQAEKRQRYVEMVRVCHPDQNQSVPADAIQTVNAAWEVIRQQGVEL